MAYDSGRVEPVSSDDPGYIEPLPSDSGSDRALYSGDISNTILQRFAAWEQDNLGYNPFNWSNHYFIVRTGDSTYKGYFGDIESDGKINSADVVTYQAVSAGAYNTAWTWSVSHVQSGVVDLAGYSGYIYSSYSTYQSNPYMVQYHNERLTSACVYALLFFCCIVCIGFLIKGWFINGSRKQS